MEHDIIMEAAPDDGKYCTDCVHKIGKNLYDTEHWRCGHMANVSGTRTDLVTGLKHKIFNITDIYKVREEQCKGDLWEKYNPPVREPTIGGSVPTEIVFDDDALKANREAANKRVEELKVKRNKQLSKGDLENL